MICAHQEFSTYSVLKLFYFCKMNTKPLIVDTGQITFLCYAKMS